MRSLVLLFALALPLAAQPQGLRRGQSIKMPPEMIAPDDLVRDIVRVAPTHVTVDMENDRTRVLRTHLGSGESLPTHDDRAGVLVCLTDCHLRFTSPEGQTENLDLKAGASQWLPAARRITRNAATAPLHMLYIESKRPQT